MTCWCLLLVVCCWRVAAWCVSSCIDARRVFLLFLSRDVVVDCLLVVVVCCLLYVVCCLSVCGSSFVARCCALCFLFLVVCCLLFVM